MDQETLLHIIKLQQNVIEGKDIKAIFRKNMNTFRTDTGANIITVCAKENKQVNFKYILEENYMTEKIIHSTQNVYASIPK